MMTRGPIVRMEGITKRFPGVLANDGVDFEIWPGVIHALLGENGAGKSTLMSILSGLYRADEGTIYVDGQPVTIRSPRDALGYGIGMVHQHFMLVPSMTVAENLTLGMSRPRFLLRRRELKRMVEGLVQAYGLRVDPDAYVWQLSVGEQQRVEILKMLNRDVRVLILDEPTAVLTPQEVDELFKTLRRMAEEGRSVVLISHKLTEVLRIADRITVLRKGRVVATMEREQASTSELARLMIGREVERPTRKRRGSSGAVVLAVEGVCSLDDRGMPALDRVSFELHEGEILGVAGVAGNGQRELVEVMMGVRRATAGRVVLYGCETTNCPPRTLLDAKVGFVPEDRLGDGLAPNLSVGDNVIMKSYRDPALRHGPLLSRRRIAAFVRRVIERFRIVTPSPSVPVRRLSGGNLQRILLAREISLGPRVLIAVHPTRGLDVGATEEVHRLLLKQKEEGAAILLISEDLEELMALADRIAVLYEGRLMGIVSVEEARLETLGLMMAGVQPEAEYAASDLAPGGR